MVTSINLLQFWILFLHQFWSAISNWIRSSLSCIANYRYNAEFAVKCLSVTQGFELLSAVLFLLWLLLFVGIPLFWMIGHWFHKVFFFLWLILKVIISSACISACLHSICATIQKLSPSNHFSKQKFSRVGTCEKENDCHLSY